MGIRHPRGQVEHVYLRGTESLRQDTANDRHPDQGAGLLGNLLGLALSQTGARTFLEDRDPGAVATAVGMGAGTDADCPAPEVVFVAVPPDQIAREVAAALTRFPQATVSDVGSVKSEPIAALSAAVAADLSRYVGGHPMAGREISAAAGRGDLFEDRPRILTPVADTDPQRLAQVSGLAQSTHAVARLMDPDEHDRRWLCAHTHRKWSRRCWPRSCSVRRRQTSVWLARRGHYPHRGQRPGSMARSCSPTPSTWTRI